MSDVANAEVYQLKVSLRRISPMIWRRLLVPEEMTLFGLHRTIQIAFGWEDYHLHAFKLHGRHYGTTRTGERHRDAAGTRVLDGTLDSDFKRWREERQKPQKALKLAA